MSGVEDGLAFESALELARLVRDRQVPATELVELFARRIEDLNPGLGSYVTVATERALKDAKETKPAAPGLPIFHGVPIAIKDLNETAGTRTTHGSALFADRVPERDDAVVARLREAGFINLGKTAVPEFGYSFVSEPPAYPPARNPWNPDVTPGGSSGGAASAVAAGLAPVAQGSDAGGSIRLPAARCGLYGLKPSRGRVSAAPYAEQLTWQNGPITRTVADSAAMLDVMAGYETGDAWWAPPPDRRFLAQLDTPPGPLRIAMSTGGGTDIYPGSRASLETAARLLSGLGHHVEEAEPLPDWGVVPPLESVAAGMGFTGVEISRYPLLPPLDQVDFEMLDPFVRTCLEQSRTKSAVEYVARWDAILVRARAAVALWDRFDLLLAPITAGPALEIGAGRDRSTPELFRLWWSNSPFLGLWNLTGQPAASIPIDLDDAGMPVSVQLVGPPAGDGLVLRVSAQVEEARPWAHLRPPLPGAQADAG